MLIKQFFFRFCSSFATKFIAFSRARPSLLLGSRKQQKGRWGRNSVENKMVLDRFIFVCLVHHTGSFHWRQDDMPSFLHVMLVPLSTRYHTHAKCQESHHNAKFWNKKISREEGEGIGDDSLYLSGVNVSGGRIKFIREWAFISKDR